ncbi:MAG: response regulator [Bryobacterales bacterium]|nr:response regulator [Bryobacterales bacterium]
MASILVVDDETALLRLLALYLSRDGHLVVTCPTAGDGLSAMVQQRFDAAVLDHWLPDMDGTELIHQVRRVDPAIPILVSSGSLMDIGSLGLPETPPTRLLQKPYAPKALLEALDSLLQR